MKAVSILLLCFMLSGCVTATSLKRINPGMTKTEVLNILGSPCGDIHKDSVEYLKYNFASVLLRPDVPASLYDYYIRFVDGKVESYGKADDYHLENVQK